MGALSDAVRELPPLLFMLESRVSVKGDGSRNRGIPIDADALELWAQIRDTLREWAGQVHSFFDGYDLVGSFGHWSVAFANTVVPDSRVEDTVRVLESWAARIRARYAHAQIREWVAPCPKCGESKISVDRNGEQVHSYAVSLNVTAERAECSQCGEVFEGRTGLSLLRLLTNVSEQIAEGVTPNSDALTLYRQYHSNNGVSEVA